MHTTTNTTRTTNANVYSFFETLLTPEASQLLTTFLFYQSAQTKATYKSCLCRLRRTASHRHRHRHRYRIHVPAATNQSRRNATQRDKHHDRKPLFFYFPDSIIGDASSPETDPERRKTSPQRRHEAGILVAGVLVPGILLVVTIGSSSVGIRATTTRREGKENVGDTVSPRGRRGRVAGRGVRFVPDGLLVPRCLSTTTTTTATVRAADGAETNNKINGNGRDPGDSFLPAVPVGAVRESSRRQRRRRRRRILGGRKRKQQQTNRHRYHQQQRKEGQRYQKGPSRYHQRQRNPGVRRRRRVTGSAAELRKISDDAGR